MWENKNQYTLAYLNMLVETGVFKNIKVGFLLVGHTHDQIDQMFIRFSKKLKYKSALTLPTMVEIIKGLHTPSPNIIFLEDTLDYMKLITNTYPSPVEEMKGVLYQR